MPRPETRYARSSDGAHIAWQTHGAGPLDLVFVHGFVSNLELHWEEPGLARFLARLGGFARVVRFAKRGTGLSDPVADLPSLETRMDDVRAVADAAGVERAVLLGGSEGGPMSMPFAAAWPERVRALVLYGSYAHFHPAVLPPDRLEAFVPVSTPSGAAAPRCAISRRDGWTIPPAAPGGRASSGSAPARAPPSRWPA
ncbi:alpha/beta fold hydrolase [Caldovatus aquaticus]|uniref:Alpha/beta hydrolase n=1 Tax=Caldovatus aquaticus TaxID=2865671 RepID=A0ABS7F3H1_9PROT|nr:alpha/beta hydrolase [Caldovatus aquaticus]MBW8270119.1 alpha/beta hydrolase [Caldovatus aquaticus]